MKLQFRSIFPCLFFLFSLGTFSQVTIDSEDFQSGWGNWVDGGSDCAKGNYGLPNTSTRSIRLRDNSGVDSSITSGDIDLTPYLSVSFTFEFEGEGMEIGEDFWVQYSSDGGSNWTTIASYAADTDFVNGDFYNPTIKIDSSSYIFTTYSQFRIICDASANNDKIYIDNILIEGEIYCSSYGDDADGYETSTGRVIFNTIDNSSGVQDNDYSDFTSISTTLILNASYDLSVYVNADPSFSPFHLVTPSTMVWIDWNQDGDFDDSGEAYDLGSGLFYANNSATSNSPHSITVPAGAELGSTRMRVSTKAGSYSASCETGFDGEVEDYTIIVVSDVSKIDFDGIDDYVDFGDNHDFTGSFTLEAWVLQENSVTSGTIISKGDMYSSNSKSYGYFLSIKNNDLTFTTYKNGGGIKLNITSNYPITNDRWYHIAMSYDGTTANLYVDGLFVGSDTSTNTPGNRSESCYIGASYDRDNTDPINYFDGFIDEVRIWNSALSVTQIREMMNQEIEKNGTAVKGRVVPRDISEGLLWANLIGYYDMNNDEATDGSESGIDGVSKYIGFSQDQTAPLPYYTDQDGIWDDNLSTTPWVYGDSVWGIPNWFGVDGTTYIDWNIIKVSHNIDVDRTIFLGSLISESTALVTDEEITDSELTIGADGNDYELNISHYLKLDGKIDLQNESQLVQGDGSWLDVDSSGYVERDQQGTANSYTYNYWSLPVSKRNTALNNFAPISEDVLRDGHRIIQDDIIGLDFDPDSTSSVDPYYADGTASNPRKIATYWMWKFVNSQTNDYANWEWVGNYYGINVTEGFSMKGISGTGNIDMAVENQNYVFRGKPNNVLNGESEIVHTSFTAAFDSNGNPKISLTGNPFLSTIDANLFIDDNANSINGQLYFWEHWGGNSHKYALYQGGYSIYTKTGGVAAVSHENVSQVGNGSKTPERYIPIAQGFYVIQKHDIAADNSVSNPHAGDVVFKNSQRIFKTESSGQSVFTKETTSKTISEFTYTPKIKSTPDNIQRIRIGFESPDGFYRSVMLGFLDGATDKIDYGYDAVTGDVLKNDGFLVQDNRNFVILAFGEFQESREIPIAIFIDEDSKGGIQKIAVESIENFDESIQIFIKDKENLGAIHEITNSNFRVGLQPGTYKDRFSIVFQSRVLSLDILPNLDKGFEIFMNNREKEIHINRISEVGITEIKLFNSLGQSIKVWDANLAVINLRLSVDIDTGVYFIRIKTPLGIVSKKIFVE